MFCILLLLAIFQLTEGDLNIRSFHIHSEIKFRLARTVISSTIENIADEAEEIKFDVAIPNNAFISNMTLEMDGSVYKGIVKEKQNASAEYTGAKSDGITAGFISTTPRRANKFQLRVNVEAKKIATFNLTYEELLRRYTGKYEHKIYLSPGKPVDDFKVDVSILETRDIKKLKIPAIQQDLIQSKGSLQSDSLTDVVIKQPVPTEANIVYSPTIDKQKSESQSGISGQLVVEYDVDRNKDAGDILVSGGYFVHYFGASGIPPLPKQIIFVLDKSGSMAGKKMEHLKKAMLNILQDIKENDEFNLIIFDTTVRIWNPISMVPGLKRNKDIAINYLDIALKAKGGTNVHSAIVQGLDLLRKFNDLYKAPVLVFLTDGDSNDGLTGTGRITNDILLRNNGLVPMFGLAFGEYANLELVNKIAIQNSGFSRKIFSDSDADLQIEGFYDEISTVIMTNVSFKYLDAEVDMNSVTDDYVNTLFNGSEHIVSGETTANSVTNIQSSVEGYGANGMLVLRNPLFLTETRISDFDLRTFTERLYAFLVIKKLIQKIDTSNSRDIHSEKSLLSLSLKYGFVTPVTAMVVVLPRIPNPVSLLDEEAIANEEKAQDMTIKKKPVSLQNQPATRPNNRPPNSIIRSGSSGIGPFLSTKINTGNASFAVLEKPMTNFDNSTSSSSRISNPAKPLIGQFLLILVYTTKHIYI